MNRGDYFAGSIPRGELLDNFADFPHARERVAARHPYRQMFAPSSHLACVLRLLFA